MGCPRWVLTEVGANMIETKHEKMAQIMACMLVPGSLPHFSFTAIATQNEAAES